MSSSGDYSRDAMESFLSTVPLSNGSLTFATNLYHCDGWYNAPENRTRMDSYDLVNASITWAFGAGEMYSAKLWGRNLGDEFVFSSITNQVPVTDMVWRPWSHLRPYPGHEILVNPR